MNKILLILIGILPAYVIKCSLFGIPTNLFELAVIGAFLIGIFQPIIRNEWLIVLRSIPKNLAVALGIFLLSAGISAAISHELRDSLGIVKGWFVIPALFAYIVASAIRHSRITIRQCIAALSLSGTVVAVIGILQIGSLARVHSLYDVPNSLSLFLAPLVIIALYIGEKQRDRFLLICGCMMLAAVFATGSFGGVAAIILTIAIAVIGRRKFQSWHIAISILCVMLIGSAFLIPRIPYLLSPIIHAGATNSVTVRLQLWDVGARLIQEHPFFGIGLGQFEPAYQAELHKLFAEQAIRHQDGSAILAGKLQAEYVFRDPHNWIISFWLNMGILGLLSFCYINGYAVRSGLRFGNSEQKALSFGLIAMLLYGLVDTIYWKNDLSTVWWLIVLISCL